ncbi:MAG TPA: MFS transporter [Rubrobacteraceae bacterium]|nr:MFS transporter [Rubrobacteraceae bacterium]
MNETNARAARLAVLGVFFLNGLAVASWFVRIPAVRDNLDLSEGTLGLALLGAAVGAMVSMPLAGALSSRFGSRRVVGATALLISFSLIPPALVPNLVLLVPALVLLGAANGALDVSMNSQAVVVEQRYGRTIMSSFHAAFSFGGLAGAASGGLIAAAGVGPLPHLSSVAALCAVAALVAYRPLLPASADAVGDGAPAFARPTKALLGLGVISFCVLLGEGAMADWSAVYLNDTLATGPGFAAAGYAAFSLSMAFGRLFGDRLAERLGPATLVRACGALAAIGLGLALAAGQPYLALLGFGCAGAGFSIVFPAALSAAGRTKGMAAGPALAAVSTAGYTGFLIGPPTIGFAAEVLGLGGALYIVVILSAAIVLLAGAVRAK